MPQRGAELRAKLRQFLGRELIRVAQRVTRRWLLPVDFVPREFRPRWGYGRPPHARLTEILARDEDAYRANLETIVSYHDDMSRIDRRLEAASEPWWLSAWLPGLDAAALYAFVRARAPRMYMEVGSGMSTLFARRAIRDGSLETRITSVDPEPREDVSAVTDRLLREPLETLDLSLFSELREGDILFMDGSHRVLTNSDATVFFLEVLPELPAGVLVGVHDILLPDDYLPMWTEFYWSEQYLMGAWLLAEGSKVQLELAARYVTAYSELREIVAPLWEAPNLAEVDRRGFALWMTTTGR